MKDTLKRKLESISERHQEVSALLSDAATIADQARFRKLSQEFAEIEPVVACFRQYCNELDNIEAARLMIDDADPDMREMGQDEYKLSSQRRDELELELQRLMLPRDPNDARNVYLEIRGGAGGDEAAIFAGDLFRMYSRYAESQGWRVEIVSENPGEHGGYKEIISRIAGQNVYSRLKFESGAHRVQRVPETEAQGRIHTSTCTVAILPEADEIEDIDIRPDDIKMDTFRSSGAGGQHVNTTDSAVRLTHLPTGTVVECQDERSQHKNRAKAMALLRARLLSNAQEAQSKQTSETRRLQVGTGDRSERIRTYNFPQGRLTDHRINLTLYKLDEIVEGDLGSVLQALTSEYQADQLAALSANE